MILASDAMDQVKLKLLQPIIIQHKSTRRSFMLSFQEQYNSQVILFEAVHLIHEWMEEKLQTYFSRDTERLNHNT